MDTQLFLSIVLSFLPFIELRGGLPVVLDYCLKNSLSIWPYFFLIVFINCLIIPIVFLFMDFLHIHFMKIPYYKKFMDRYIEKVKFKGRKLEKREGFLLYFLLCIFVAVPLPGTGAWTGTILAWLSGFNRKASFIAISVGVLLSGIIILSIFLGLVSLF